MATQKYTELNGFFIFLNACKIYFGDNGLFKPWYAISKDSWKQLTPYERKQWNTLGYQLQNSPLGIHFTYVDMALKTCDPTHKYRCKKLLRCRDNVCMDLYVECREMLLWTLETRYHRQELKTRQIIDSHNE